MHGYAESCSRRIEDCISDLDLDTCMQALSGKVVRHDSQHKAILELWAHSREIAHWCRIIAEETQDPYPNDAYLLGLFHAVGSLPAILGWVDLQENWMDSALVGAKLVKQWPLPHCAVEFFQAQVAGLQTKQLDMVLRAHQHVSRSSIDCVSRERMRRHFLHAV
jgi:HD-like signal output (HDOD) protein